MDASHINTVTDVHDALTVALTERNADLAWEVAEVVNGWLMTEEERCALHALATAIATTLEEG